jgi:2-C-methyl-D-erythritol 4-phosphate cytidylyltransferase
MAVALIVAAGRGERFGSGRPKALVTLSGRPMVEWSVETLRATAGVQRIVVACPPDEPGCAPAGTIGVPGGAVRSESVRLALSAAGEGDPVIVHDAARPLASVALFERALAALQDSEAAAVIAAVPVSDTIKELRADGPAVARTLDRSRLWAVQTPQVFRRGVLEQALSAASAQALATATDDAWLIEQSGGLVHVVRGETENIKVTTPIDLRIAEMLLAGRAGHPA